MGDYRCYYAVLIFSTLCSAQAQDVDSCVLPYKSVLSRNGFTGLMDCSKGAILATEVGQIRMASQVYSIIDYRYRTAPSPGGSSHGGQRILVIENHRKYLGQYAMSPPPFLTISVRENRIFAGESEIKFAPGPPAKALVDGYLVSFSK
jgi:hypothetical protein